MGPQWCPYAHCAGFPHRSMGNRSSCAVVVDCPRSYLPRAPSRKGRVRHVRRFRSRWSECDALFSLRAHRGEGMLLLAMDWKTGEPPIDFVGFGIEYQEPARGWYPVLNRLSFTKPTTTKVQWTSSLTAPIQKFRWVHFPRNAELAGEFGYRVTPIFMDEEGNLNQGEPQQILIALQRDTYPGAQRRVHPRVRLVTGLRRPLRKDGPISNRVPASADKGLAFKTGDPDALKWMGFEAVNTSPRGPRRSGGRRRKLGQRHRVRPQRSRQVVDRLVKIGNRLRVIIDNSGSDKKKQTSAENPGRRPASRRAPVRPTSSGSTWA